MGCSSGRQVVADMDVDPRVPFTHCQLLELKTFWNLVKKRCEEIARENLVTFFHLHPEMRQLFPGLQHLRDDDMRYNPAFEAQAMAIFSLYDDVIVHMEKDVDYVIDKLQEVGRFHAKIPNFQAEFFQGAMQKLEKPPPFSFQYFEEPLILSLADRCSDSFTDTEEVLVRQLFTWIEQVLAEEVILMGDS